VSDVLRDSAHLGEFARRLRRPREGGRAAHASALPYRPDPAGQRWREPAARGVGPTGVPVGPTLLLRCRLVSVYPVRP
jgi:hypothetical protein